MYLKSSTRCIPALLRFITVLQIVFLAFAASVTAQTSPVLNKFIPKVPAGELVEGADAYGNMLDNIPVAPILKGGEVIGYAYITSDFVGTTGYSGKPIHVMVAIDNDAKLPGATLVRSEERRVGKECRR